MGTLIDKPGTFPKQRPDQVVTWERSDLFSAQAWPRYNPDSLVGRKGLGVYEMMLVDEQVKAVVTFKRDAILGRGWQFAYDDDDDSLATEEKAARIKLFTRILDSMDHPFIDALRGVFSALAFGFSVSEKVYTSIEVDGVRRVGLRALLTRDPRTFEFYTDAYGILSAIKQRANGGLQDVDQDRVVHCAHNAEMDRYYGQSELKAAYRSYYVKDVVSKLWPIYLERFAGGFLVANEPAAGPLSEKARGELQALVRNARNVSGIVLPPGVELEAVMPASTDQYEKAIQFHDLAIAKALLVPNLLGVSHTGQTGAYSQSQTQLEAFMWHINALGQSFAEVLNKQLFRDLGDQNWGDGTYPDFRFKRGTMDDAKWLATTWASFVEANIAVSTLEDESFLRKLLGMPPRAEDTPGVADEVAQRNQERAVAQAKAMPQPPAPENKPPQFTVNAPVSVSVPAPVATALPASAEAGHGLADDADSSGGGAVALHVHGTPRVGMAAFTRALQRVNFAVIEKRTEDTAASVVPALAAKLARAVKRALGDDATVAALIDDDPSDIAAFELNAADVGKIKGSFLDVLRAGWNVGQSMAANEIDRARGVAREAPAMATHMAALRDKAAAYFDANAFRMAGNLRDGARSIIQQNLQQAVKGGWTVAQTRANIWDTLTSKGFTDQPSVRATEDDGKVVELLDALWLDSEPAAVAYLNTLVRTNVFEAMNEARYNEFTDPALGDFVQALEYSAILDERTTEICQSLDGKTWSTDSPLWDEFRPPNHYNCRSVLIPVTQIDGWDGIESTPPPADVQPQEGFG